MSLQQDKSASNLQHEDLFGEYNTYNHRQDAHGGKLGFDVGVNFPIQNFYSALSVGAHANNLSAISNILVKDESDQAHANASILKNIYTLSISNRIGYLWEGGYSAYLKASLLWAVFSHQYEGIEMFDVNLFGIENRYSKKYIYKKPGFGVGIGISYLVHENILGYLEYEVYLFNPFNKQMCFSSSVETHKIQIRPKYEQIVLGIRYIL